MKREEEEQIESQSDEPSLEDFVFDEQELARKQIRGKKRKKIFKYISLLLILALLINIWGIFPQLYNLPSIQFLFKSSQLSKDKDIQEWKEAVVSINGSGKKGTGFNIEASGLIITNYHVVEGMNPIMVTFPDGQLFNAVVTNRDSNYDVALLHIDGKNLPLLPLNPTSEVDQAKPVYIIGNPLAHSFIVNEGITAGTSHSHLPTPALLIDAPIHSGNSGSPVIMKDGNVIGVIYAVTDRTSTGKTIGLAIPIQDVVKALDLD